MGDPLRYVVLRHEGVEEPHFDLMFETKKGSDLATWRVGEWPVSEGSEFKQLRAHRRAYLQYEGAISGERGMVHRVHEGTHVVEADGAEELVVRLEGGERMVLPKKPGAGR
jgi:hypothetical protein